MSNRKKKDRFEKGILMSESDLIEALKKLDDWKIKEGKLERKFYFDSFIQAFSFLAGAAILSESMNHKFEFYSFDREVVIKLETIEIKGISTIDVLLAKKLDSLLMKSA